MRVKGDSVAGEASGGVVGGGQKADARPGLELCWWCRGRDVVKESSLTIIRVLVGC